MDAIKNCTRWQCVVVGCGEPAPVGAYCVDHEAREDLICDSMERTREEQLACDFTDYICNLAEKGGP